MPTYRGALLEALHCFPKALAQLGELAWPEQHGCHAPDNHQLGQPQAEEAFKGAGLGCRV
jgi:hypothetical protein